VELQFFFELFPAFSPFLLFHCCLLSLLSLLVSVLASVLHVMSDAKERSFIQFINGLQQDKDKKLIQFFDRKVWPMCMHCQSVQH
jgi:hypothetical protein